MEDELITAIDENITTGLEIHKGDVYKAVGYMNDMIHDILIEYATVLKEEIKCYG